MSSQDRTTVAIRRETKPRFEEAKTAVAEEIGEEPTNPDVVEELIQAYLGHDALGRWRENDG